MNLQEAIKLLEDATATISTDRKTHIKMLEAIKIIREKLEEEDESN